MLIGLNEIYAESGGYYGDNKCIIKLNDGPNICQNKRGHNIVVIDPRTEEYESVSFDTYKSKDEVLVYVFFLIYKFKFSLSFVYC